MDDAFYTIRERSEGMLKDRGSKFIGMAWPVNDETDIEQKLDLARQEHSKARHHCYAWRLGIDDDQFRANDDGEPSGTAGRPILGQIDKLGLTNVLVVVVRYFGGRLLGTGGLIQAYKGAAGAALENAKMVKDYLKARMQVETSYEHLQAIISYVKGNDWPMLNESYGATCTFEVPVRLSHVEAFETYLNQFKNTKVAAI